MYGIINPYVTTLFCSRKPNNAIRNLKIGVFIYTVTVAIVLALDELTGNRAAKLFIAVMLILLVTVLMGAVATTFVLLRRQERLFDLPEAHGLRYEMVACLRFPLLLCIH